jgi:hypothetical protein
VFPCGGFISAISENPTSFPAPKRLRLSWGSSIYLNGYIRGNEITVGLSASASELSRGK